MPSRRGLSLLEVLIAFFLILVISLFIMSMISTGQTQSVRAQQYSVASFLCNAKTQELLAVPAGLQQAGGGKFASPFQDYSYQITLSPFEGTIQMLEVDVVSSRGALAMTRTLVDDLIRFFGVAVDPYTNRVAFSPAGGTQIGFYAEATSSLSMSSAAPGGRAVEGLACRPGMNLLWTSAEIPGLIAYTESSPADTWKAALPLPPGAVPCLFTGLAADAYGARVFGGDATNRCIWMVQDAGAPSFLPTPIKATAPPLGAPAGVATDATGSLVWVVDRENQCLRKLLVSDVAPNYPPADREAVPGVGWWHTRQYRPPALMPLGAPQGVATDSNGWAVYMVDGAHLFQYVESTDTWTQLLAFPSAIVSAGPSGLALDEFNNLLYLNCRQGQLWRIRLSDLSTTRLWP